MFNSFRASLSRQCLLHRQTAAGICASIAIANAPDVANQLALRFTFRFLRLCDASV